MTETEQKLPPFHEVTIDVLMNKGKHCEYLDTEFNIWGGRNAAMAAVAYALRLCHIPEQAKPAVLEAIIWAATNCLVGVNTAILWSELAKTLVALDGVEALKTAFRQTRECSEKENLFYQFWEYVSDEKELTREE